MTCPDWDVAILPSRTDHAALRASRLGQKIEEAPSCLRGNLHRSSWHDLSGRHHTHAINRRRFALMGDGGARAGSEIRGHSRRHLVARTNSKFAVRYQRRRLKMR